MKSQNGRKPNAGSPHWGADRAVKNPGRSLVV